MGQFVFPLITFPYSSRILGPDGIGSVNFIDSFTQYFLLFSSLGIPIYGIREVARRKDHPEELNKLVSEIFSIHIVSTIIFSIIYLVAALSIPALRSNIEIVFVGIGVMFFSTLGCEWFFQGIEKFGYITGRALILRVLSIIFLFVFLHKDSPPVIYYVIGATPAFLGGILNQYNLNKKINLKLTTVALKKHIKPLLFILSSTLAVSVYLLLDNIILGLMKGDAAVGIYSTALKIVRIPMAIIGAMSAAIVPAITRAFSMHDNEKVAVLIQKSFSFVCVAIIPIAFGMIISSSFLVETFAGKKFEASEFSLKTLSPVILLIGLNNIFGVQLLTPLGKEKFFFIAVSGGMVCSIVLNLFLIPSFSFVGAAITNLCTEVVVTLLCFYFVRKYIAVSFDMKIFFQCLFAASMFFPIAFLIHQFHFSYILTELLIIISSTVFYITFIWLFIKNEYVDNIKHLLLSKLRLSTN